MKNNIRKVISLLLALVMIVGLLPAVVFAASTPDTLYLKPNSNWLVDNARFAAYFFGAGDTWVDMSDADGDGYYEVAVPAGFTSVIFCRMNPATTANNWNNKWNQTADLAIPSDGTNCWTLKSGDWSGAGAWSTHTVEPEVTEPEVTEPVTDPVAVDYYLFGYINGANYGCEEDYENMGEYKFVDGTLVATFESNSYVGIKTTDNDAWYMTNGWQGEVTSATLYNTDSGITADKLFVPGGVEVTFTLVVNDDDTLTLSYVAASTECDHSYTSEVTTAPTCLGTGVKTHTCSKCGDVYSEEIAATGHDYTETVVPPTCENNGYTIHSCKNCTYSYNDTPVNPIGHDYSSVVTDPTCTEKGYTTYTCGNCGNVYTWNETPAAGHKFSGGSCTVCGEVDADFVLEYYLIGNINGANYGCDEDYENMGDYKFVDGALTVTFTTDSYVFIKTTDNAAWYMTQAYTTTSSATLYNTASGSANEKLFVPGNVEVTFKLVVNENDSLTLSYTVNPDTCEHASHTTAGACTICGTSVDHTYDNGACTICGAVEPTVDYYLFGYINGVDYATGDELGEYKFENGALTVTFTEDSYVAVKTGSAWYMANGYQGEAASVTLRQMDPASPSANKMFVPGNKEVTFTLSKNWDDSLTLSYTVAASDCEHATHSTSGICDTCGQTVEHKYTYGVCSICGVSDPDYVEVRFYLFGYINGANYGCEEDAANVGHFIIRHGGASFTFTENSYIAIKTGDNATWYMTKEYVTDTTGTFYNTAVHTDAKEKMFVPAGVKLNFTLVENEDGSLTLSYTAEEVEECTHESHDINGFCTKCHEAVEHTYVNGKCSCGATETVEVIEYYLFGFINGANYGCEEDYENMGEYKFVDGTLVVTFAEDSYVAVKTTNNGAWYMTNGYHESSRIARLFNTANGLEFANKMFVPGGVEVTFTLVVNNDDTLTLSYVPSEEICEHPTHDIEGVCPDCGEGVDHTYVDFVCTVCGKKCSHNWANGTCDLCGKVCDHPAHDADGDCTTCAVAVGHKFVDGKCSCGATETVEVVDYYLFGFINGANYACEEDAANMGAYKFVDGKLVVTFASDSYVAIKTTDNASWYMTDGWLGTDVTSATLYNTSITGENSNKLFVPGGVEVTFTLTVNEDGSLTLSYVAKSEPVVKPTLTLKFPTVSFEDEIIMNVFFEALDLGNITPDKMGLITFNSNVADGTIENADFVIPGAVLNGATGFYCANTQGIAAKNLGDKVYFRAYVQLPDGSYVYSNMASYSPMKYAYSVLNGNYGNDMKALVAAMLNYGAAAQVYFNHNTDALVNADMTAAHKALVEAYNSSMIAPVVKADSAKAANFVNNGGFSRRYPSISFESAFSINYFFAPAYSVDGDITLYYWTTADYNKVSKLTTANATGSVVATAGSEYEAAVKGIAAKDLDGTIYVAAVYKSNGTTYGSGVLAYSIGAYCLDRITNGSATMQSFASATAVYGYYAKAYFAK